MTHNLWKYVTARALAVGLIAVSNACFVAGRLAAEPAEPLTVDTLGSLQKQIRPQPGESRWLEVPWLLDLHEARRQAAALGKPLFVYSGGGASGIGAC